MDTGIGPTGCERMLSIAVNEGGKKCRNFVNSALSVGQSVIFYNPISKSKLKTFEHMNAKTPAAVVGSKVFKGSMLLCIHVLNCAMLSLM
jgi:hypothetical protein